MSGFVKVWEDITKSTVWEADPVIRVVWLSLLLECDRNGNFHGTREALARRANVSLDEFNRALEYLMAPDPNSTSPDEEGRRILSLGNNQWTAVNYLQYRERRDPEEEREKSREWKRGQRARKRAQDESPVTPVQPGPEVSTSVHECPDIADADADAEAEESVAPSAAPPRSRARFTPPSVEEVAEYCRLKGYTEVDSERFWAYYQSKGWTVGKSPMRDWRAAVQTWRRNCVDKRPGAAVSSQSGESARDRAERFAREEAERMKAEDAEREAWKRGGSK